MLYMGTEEQDDEDNNQVLTQCIFLWLETKLQQPHNVLINGW